MISISTLIFNFPLNTFLQIFGFYGYLPSTFARAFVARDESEIRWVFWRNEMVHFVLIFDSTKAHLFAQYKNMALCLITNWSTAHSTLSGNVEEILQYQIFF